MTDTVLYVDNTYGTLGSGAAAADTTLALTSGHGVRFPGVGAGQVLYATIVDSTNKVEQIHITAHSGSSDSLTVTRGANGTTAKAWSAGSRVECRLTSEHMTAIGAAAATGTITSSSFTMPTGELLGRTTAGTGAIEGLTVAGSLALSAGVLSDYQWLCFALSDQTSVITTGTKLTVRLPACTVLAVRASVQTASSLGTPTFDIDENGVSILSTLLTIDANEKTSTTAATPAVISDANIADDSEITFEIDVAGTGAIGAMVYMKVRWV